MAELLVSIGIETSEMSKGLKSVIIGGLYGKTGPDFDLIVWFLKKGADRGPARTFLNDNIGEWHRNAVSVADVGGSKFTPAVQTMRYGHSDVDALIREADALFCRDNRMRDVLEIRKLERLGRLLYCLDNWRS